MPPSRISYVAHERKWQVFQTIQKNSKKVRKKFIFDLFLHTRNKVNLELYQTQKESIISIYFLYNIHIDHKIIFEFASNA